MSMVRAWFGEVGRAPDAPVCGENSRLIRKRQEPGGIRIKRSTEDGDSATRDCGDAVLRQHRHNKETRKEIKEKEMEQEHSLVSVPEKASGEQAKQSWPKTCAPLFIYQNLRHSSN